MHALRRSRRRTREQSWAERTTNYHGAVPAENCSSPRRPYYFSPKHCSVGTMRYPDKQDPSSTASKSLPNELPDLGKHLVQGPIGRNSADGGSLEAKI
jgi:hypothetical protein